MDGFLRGWFRRHDRRAAIVVKGGEGEMKIKGKRRGGARVADPFKE